MAIQLFPGKRSILDLLMKRQQEDMVEMKVRQVMGRVPFHAWLRGGYLRILPLAFALSILFSLAHPAAGQG